MNRLLSLVMVAVAFAACGPVQSLLTDGTYVSGTSAVIPGATLVIDRTAKTATVTAQDAGAVVFTLVEVPPTEWIRGCPTNFSFVDVETLTVTPDPAIVGGFTLYGSKFSAGCGLDSANPDWVRFDGSNADGGGVVTVEFTRLQR
jgi:hypothetical protein